MPPVRELHPVSASSNEAEDQPANSQVDLSDVRGQYQARFGLEVAAAGGHHVLFSGVPGSGKTMLAQRLPGILPRLGDEEAMEVTAIASITEAAHHMKSLRRERPFESPHHSATVAAIIGGGARVPAPGAVSRAHHGVLFLDEAPEFPRNVLEALRQPLETGTVSLQRSAARVKYPARFQLVLAANPCPCGMNVGSARDCICSVVQRRQYMSRLSGPLLDRVDIQISVERPTAQSLAISEPGESSTLVRQRVETARAAQVARLKPFQITVNHHMSLSLLTRELKLPPQRTRSLDHALDRGQFSLRGYVRILRLAWTLADIHSSDAPTADDIDTAIQLRAMTPTQMATV